MAQVRANYEFWAENDAELSFQIGDIITVINRDDEGWWEGELNGRRGLFPSNYVEPYTAINNYRAGAGGANRFNNTNTNNTNNYQPSWASNNNNNNNNNNNKWNNNNNNNNNNNWNNKTKPTTTPTTGGWNQQAQWARTDGDAAVITRVDNDWTSDRGMPDAASAKFALKKPANLDTYNSILNAYNAPSTTETAQPVARAATTTSPKIEEPVKKPAAATTAFAPRAKVSPTKYGLWASNMGDMTGLSMIGMGICSIVWALVDVNRFGILCQYTGLYGIGMGLCVFLYENSRFGQTRGASRIPWRAIGYGAISIFQFFSLPMLMTALFCIIVAGVNLLSTVKGEVYDRTAKQSHGTQDNGYFSDLYSYLISIKEQNKIGVLVFMFAYFAANIVIFFVVLWDFIGQIAAAEAATGGNGPSYWIPYAKAFGNILDFNGSIIVLPVCRTFLRMLYNRSTADQGFFARCLRGVLYFIPIDKNLAFHKLIAKGIMIGTVGHTIAHFLNFANAPTITFATFGISPFLTGGILCVTVLLIFSAARDNTRRGQFEIFWYSHHTFVIFFVVQLFHGKGSINPNYWKWFAGPGTLYFLERCLRIYRANQKVVVLSVTMMDDVFSLEFAKEGVFEAPYMEGQYMFIQSPAISQIQWHPFTISSAPQEQSVTVHIRVQGEGSWTRGLREYIGAMGPRGKPYFQLDRQGPSGKLLGKILGPDGKPMLHIDGPHSAPTQHIGEYSAVIVAGAGIGVTPVAATLKSIVFHRWKYFIGQCFPDHAYFVWVCGHKDIHAFRWLVRHIKDAQDEVTHMRATNPQNMASKTFEFHIYVSSVPKDQKPVDVVVDDEVGFWGVPREDAKVDKVRCNWDEADLYKAMMCPSQHIELGDVHVWNGRPAWDPRFQAVSRNHPHMDIGVMFCGNPAIGKDLRRQCHIHSKGRSQGIFKLHKENF